MDWFPRKGLSKGRKRLYIETMHDYPNDKPGPVPSVSRRLRPHVSWSIKMNPKKTACLLLFSLFAFHCATQKRAEEYSPESSLTLSQNVPGTGIFDESASEWGYQKPEIFVQMGHIAGSFTYTNAVCFTHDGKYVLSGNGDGRIKLWNMETGREVRTYQCDDHINHIDISENGRYVVSGDEGFTNNINIWDIVTGRSIRTFPSSGLLDMNPVLFCNDDRAVLSGNEEGTLRVWDIETGKIRQEFHRDSPRDSLYTPFISAIVMTQDGKRVVTGSRFSGVNEKNEPISATENTIRVWSMESGKELFAFNKGNGWVEALGITPDGRHLLSGDWEQDSIRIWDPETGRQIRALRTGGTSAIAVSAGGRYALFGGPGQFTLWDITSGKEIRRMDKEINGWVRSIAFSPDGKQALLGDESTSPKLWDIATGRLVKAFSGNTQVAGPAAVTADGSRMLIAEENSGRLNLWDITAGEKVKTIQHAFWITSMAMSRDGLYAVVGGYDYSTESVTVRTWDIASGEEGMTLYSGHGEHPSVLAITSDDGYVFWSVADTIFVSEMATGRMVMSLKEERDRIRDNRIVSVSSDGRVAITSVYLPDEDAFALKIWDVFAGKVMKIFKDKHEYCAALDDDGNTLLILSHEWDGSQGILHFTLWNIKEGRTIRAFFADHELDKRIQWAALGRDARFALWADEMTLHLWDLNTGREMKVFSGHDDYLTSIGICPDGRSAYSSSADGTTRIWDFASGKESARFVSFMDGEWIAITPEGYYTCSANGDAHLNVRIGGEVFGIENYREAFYRPDLVTLALRGSTLQNFRQIADVKQPPSVSIVNAPQEASSGEMTVTLRIEDRGGGIGDIRVFLNGTAVVMESLRGMMIVPNEKEKPSGQPGKSGQQDEKDGKAVYKRYTIKLTSGKNVIRTLVFNGDNTMQSNEALHEVTAFFQTTVKPSLYALVVGINEYQNPAFQLKYPVADAELFSTTLQKTASTLYQKTNIRKLITQEETSRESILRELVTYHTLNPEDVFVFYVASHGTVDDGEYFLITSNVGSTRTEKLKTDAISQTVLKEVIANIPATKKLIVLDTCNAGALGDALQVALLTRGMSEDAAIKILSRAVGVTILSASTSVQEALEGYNQHGLFTYVLSEGLQGRADKGNSGYVKTTDLADYVDNEVPAIAEKTFNRAQYPTISISGQGFPIGKVR